MRADSSEPATEAPSVPSFTLGEIGERLDVMLGRGATGAVYSLRGYPGLAVKEIQLSGLSNREKDALRLELVTVPGLAHPGIVKYHQVIWDDDLVYIVMDRRDKTLERLIIEYKRRKIPIELVLSAVRQIATALAYLVSGVNADGTSFQGLVHRDLKPANVLVSEDGEHFVIADFGLCRDALRSGSTLAGTRPYMAPETLVHNRTSPASDVWSLGVILYELATLKRPDFLEGREPAEVFVNGWKPDLSGVTDGFIRHVLEKIFVLDPAERPTARELSELLQASDASPRELMILINVLSDNCKALTADVGALKEALAHTSSRNEALEETVTAQKASIDAFRKELDAKTTNIEDLEEVLVAQSTKIDALEQELSVLKDLQARSVSMNVERSPASFAPARDSTWTPLMHAAADGDVEAVKKHLSDKNKKNSDGETALIIAARARHKDIVEILEPTNEDGVTALMRAAGEGDEELVKSLLWFQTKRRATGSACIDGKSIRHRTALMYAAAHGHMEIVRLLVDYEGGMQDGTGWTALMWAVKNGHPKCVELLLEKEGGREEDSGCTGLMLSACYNNVDCVNLLLEREGGKQDKKGWTALMRAVFEGHSECVELLAQKEKDIKTIQKWRGYDSGLTAFDIATRKGYKNIVAILSK